MWQLGQWLEHLACTFGLDSLGVWPSLSPVLVNFFSLCMCACILNCFSHVRLHVTLWTAAHQAPRPWDSPGKNTGVGCCALLQGIFPAQGSNLCLLHLPALAGGFFTTSTTWEGASLISHLVKNLPVMQETPV